MLLALVIFAVLHMSDKEIKENRYACNEAVQAMREDMQLQIDVLSGEINDLKQQPRAEPNNTAKDLIEKLSDPKVFQEYTGGWGD